MKQVLSVGQCSMDHGSLSRYLKSNFDVEIVPVATVDEATSRMRQQAFDLVLVNRQFDLDGTEGVDFIRQIKTDPDLAQPPVMMITNFPEYAAEAEAAGAEPGFGKAELTSPALHGKLAKYLQ